MEKIFSTYCVSPADRYLGMSPLSWGLSQGFQRSLAARRHGSDRARSNASTIRRNPPIRNFLFAAVPMNVQPSTLKQFNFLEFCWIKSFCGFHHMNFDFIQHLYIDQHTYGLRVLHPEMSTEVLWIRKNNRPFGDSHL